MVSRASSTLCAIGLILAACPSTTAPLADVQGDADGGVDVALEVAGPPPTPVPWTVRGTVPTADQSETFRVSFPASQRFIAIRVSPAAQPTPAGLCYGLGPVELASGRTLVAPTPLQASGTLVCTDCEQRVMAGDGYGLFVFSNAAEPLPEADELVFQARLVHCEYGIPASLGSFPDRPEELVVESAWEPERPDDAVGHLSVRVAVVSGTRMAPNGQVAHTTVDALWTHTANLLSQANLDGHLDAVTVLDMPPRVSVGPGARPPLDALAGAAITALSAGPHDLRFVPVILVDCLDQTDPISGGTSHPYAHTTRIPGGIRSTQTARSAIVLATGQCESWQTPQWESAEDGAALVAHEIGHYLGLHHNAGFGAHLAAPGAQLMDPVPFLVEQGLRRFSDAQVRVIRRHPDVWFDPE